MSFKKLPDRIKEALAKIPVSQLEGINKKVFAKVKSGGNFYALAPNDERFDASIFTVAFFKVNQELEGSPRVLILTDTIDKACAMAELLQLAARKLDVTVDLVHDKGNIVLQRNEVFRGTEIIIGNTKRIYDLYIQNGINFNLLELFIVDNADAILSQGKQMELKRMFESLTKTQVLLLGKEKTKRFTQFLQTSSLVFQKVK